MRRFALTPGRIVLLILLFLLTATVALVVHLPAAWAWSQVEARLDGPLPGVRVDTVGGTVWDGAGLLEVQVPGLGARPLRLDWDLQLASLFSEGAGLDWALETRQSHLTGLTRLADSETLDLRLDGVIALAEFAELARRNGLSLPGSITVTDLALRFSDEQLLTASGKGRWDGGNVVWQMGPQSGQAHFPPLLADLDEVNGEASLDIMTEAEREPLIHIRVTPEGMATMTVLRRLTQISGMEMGEGAPDDVVFRVQQPLSES